MKVQLLLLLVLSGCSMQLDIDHGHSTGQVEKCEAIADIIIVMDVSGSVTQTGYAVMQNFVIRLTEHFRAGNHDVLFGALTFSHIVSLSFTLGTYSSNAEVKAAFQRIKYTGGGTQTYKALDYVRQQGLLTPSKGARVRSSKICIVLTDGLSDNGAATATSAAALRATGARIVAVGIGKTLGTELYNIAGESRFVFSAADFNSLLAIEQLVANGTCKIPKEEGNVPTTTPRPTTTPEPTTKPPPPPTTPEPTTKPPPPPTTPNPCNPGYQPDPSNPKKCIDIDECQGKHPCQQECYNKGGTFRCNCFSGFAIDLKDKTKCIPLKACTDQVDLFFLLDSSDKVHPNSFRHIRRFPAKLMRHFLHGPTGAKVGAAQVSTDVRNLFGLNTYNKRTDVESALRASTYLGGESNIHIGLNYVPTNQVFSSAEGGRDSALDVVVLIFGGPSRFPDRAEEAADRVRSRGARLIAVGAGPSLTRAELRRLTISDNDTFHVPTLDDLDDVEKSVMEQICPSTSKP